MNGAMARRSATAVLVLGSMLSTARQAAAQEEPVRFGSTECPLDISVMWTAEVDSPVYSTPVILPSSRGGIKQIVLATLRNVELLEGDGSVPYQWPIEMDDHDDAVFLAPPALYDVDGDGNQDICVADTMGWIRWLTPGDGGPYLPAYRQYLPRRRVGGEVAELQESEDGGVDVGLRSSGRRRLLTVDEQQQQQQQQEESQADPADEEERRGVGGGSGKEDGIEATQGTDTGFDTAAAYAEAMRQWGEYGTGIDPNDDGFGWYHAAYEDDFGLDNLAEGEDFGKRRAGEDAEIEIDPHVSASPVFFSVDGSEQDRRMIVPVSYFATRRRPLTSEGSTAPSPDSLPIAGALACWDFKDRKWLWIYDLGQADPADVTRGPYVNASPSVGDLDGDGKLDVVVGTTSGDLHVIDASTGVAREGFPVNYDPIRGQVVIADVDGDQQLEMLFGDFSGTVACVKHDAEEYWQALLPGAITSMLTLGDVDGDGSLDVVISVTTPEGSGEVWALGAESGLQLPNFPVKLHNRKGISAPITLVDLHHDTAGRMGAGTASDASDRTKRRGDVAPIGGRGGGLHLLAPSEDGHVYVIEASTGCVNKIDLGERARTMVLADDVDGDGTLDLIVGTMSGEVVSLSANVPFHPLNAWSSQVRGPLNGFTHGGYQGVYVLGAPSDYGETVGRQFSLTFEIVDGSAEKRNGQAPGEATATRRINKPYQVKVFAGTEEIFRREYSRPGVQVETVSLAAPRRALLRVEMTIQPQHLVFVDNVFVGYNTRFHATLKWMIIAPMVIAALPFLWGGRGSGNARAGLPG